MRLEESLKEVRRTSTQAWFGSEERFGAPRDCEGTSETTQLLCTQLATAREAAAQVPSLREALQKATAESDKLKRQLAEVVTLQDEEAVRRLSRARRLFEWSPRASQRR